MVSASLRMIEAGGVDVNVVVPDKSVPATIRRAYGPIRNCEGANGVLLDGRRHVAARGDELAKVSTGGEIEPQCRFALGKRPCGKFVRLDRRVGKSRERGSDPSGVEQRSAAAIPRIDQ
jgi:hypothetical protein